MPIYEYVCKGCNKHHEVLQKINDTPLKKCPACGEERLAKQVSRASFRLSGSGWYETDFKTGNQRNLTQNTDKPSEAKGDTKKEKKVEKKDTGSDSSGKSKPAAKSPNSDTA